MKSLTQMMILAALALSATACEIDDGGQGLADGGPQDAGPEGRLERPTHDERVLARAALEYFEEPVQIGTEGLMDAYRAAMTPRMLEQLQLLDQLHGEYRPGGSSMRVARPNSSRFPQWFELRIPSQADAGYPEEHHPLAGDRQAAHFIWTVGGDGARPLRLFWTSSREDFYLDWGPDAQQHVAKLLVHEEDEFRQVGVFFFVEPVDGPDADSRDRTGWCISSGNWNTRLKCIFVTQKGPLVDRERIEEVGIRELGGRWADLLLRRDDDEFIIEEEDLRAPPKVELKYFEYNGLGALADRHEDFYVDTFALPIDGRVGMPATAAVPAPPITFDRRNQRMRRAQIFEWGEIPADQIPPSFIERARRDDN